MTGNNHSRRPFQLSLRSLMIGTVALGLLFAYGGTYYRLRTRGIREANEFGLKGFLYVPFEEARLRKDLTAHYRLTILFAPANVVDRFALGGPTPTKSITWVLN